jgi:hypothetical protein
MPLNLEAVARTSNESRFMHVRAQDVTVVKTRWSGRWRQFVSVTIRAKNGEQETFDCDLWNVDLWEGGLT